MHSLCSVNGEMPRGGGTPETIKVFNREHGDMVVKLPKGSQVWQIPELMMALQRGTDSSTNHAAFRRAGLVLNS
jgi:hypothetical protein